MRFFEKLTFFKHHIVFMKYFKNTSWLFFEKTLRMSIGLLVGIWLARYLGPEQLGKLSYAQSFIAIFISIATLGLDGIVIREIVKDESKTDALLGTAFLLKLFGAIAVFCLLSIANIVHKEDNETVLFTFIIASSTIFQSLNVIDFYFRSKVLSRYIVFSNICALVMSSVIKIFLILNNAPLITFVYVIAFESVIVAAGYVYFYRSKGLSILKWTFDSSLALFLLKQSWPLIIGTFAASIYMQIDQIMVKHMINDTAVGIYAVAVKLSDVWLFITIVVTSSFSPYFTELKDKNYTLFIVKLQLMYDLLLKIAFLISFITFLFSQEIVFYLFGKDYAESSSILAVYIWSIVFVFLSNLSWLFYINENLQKIASIRLIYGAVLNVVLNLFFIKLFGLIGAAYATIISYAVSSYFLNYSFVKTKPNFALQTNAILNCFSIKSWSQLLTMKAFYKG